MSDEQQHSNPWADKLQQAPLPDVDASWNGMESLLNQHMPLPEKKKRRWLLFLLFPILLIGLGIGAIIIYQHFSRGKSIGIKTQTAIDSSVDSVATNNYFSSKDSSNTVINKTGNTLTTTSSLDSPLGSFTATKNRIDSSKTRTPIAIKGFDNGKENLRTQIDNNTSTEVTKNNKELINIDQTLLATSNKKHKIGKGHEKDVKSATTMVPASSAINKVNINPKKKHKAPSSLKPFVKRPLGAYTTTNTAVVMAADTILAGKQSHISNHTVRSRSTLLTSKSRLDPMARLVFGDSMKLKKGNALTDNDLKVLKSKKYEEQKKGWTFGVGLNHYFSMRRNSGKEFDSEGISGNITDYIPVPQARYYFNNKVYLQGELQINAPQFTQNVVLQQNSYQQGSLLRNDTVYIRKLSYINLPLSLHYRPVKNLFIGGGIQFSRLNNAIVTYEQTERNLQSPLPDSGKIHKTLVQSIKNNDTLYKRLHTSEVRLLGDVNYQLKHFTAGIRYNYALRNFVKMPVTSNGEITQARNSSLQLYLRFILLDKRKKIQPRLK